MPRPLDRMASSLGAVGVAAAALVAAPSSAAQDASTATVIVVGEDAAHLERLAAAEVQRYLYHLTGDRLDIVTDAEIDDSVPIIALGQPDTNTVIAEMTNAGLLPQGTDAPGPEGYAVKTVTHRNQPAIAVLGGDDNGTLYGSYELLEHYGARFYISRDVLPEQTEPFAIKELDISDEPAIGRRGLLPWHDFLNGPSGYSYEDFTSYIDQLVKMKMNTLVLHNYHKRANEPFLDFECNGVRPEAWLDTSVDNQRWGMAPFRTGELAFRSGDYFPYDVMGSDAARYTKEQPDSQRYIIDKAKAMMQKTVRYAQDRGVEIVLGTDFDIIPASMREAGCEALDPEVLKARLDDILQTYPTLKYIQMHFNEGNDTATADGIEAYRFMRDYLAEKRPSARLLTGSWFEEERFPEMDAALPNDVIFSTLMPRDMTVRPEWEQVAKNREAWPVPWVEYDRGLSEPQLAVGRMEEQLPQLRQAGATGVIGILWREQPAEANVAYLAQDLWRAPGDVLPAADFYRDYAAHVFGTQAAQAGARALQELEEGGTYAGVGALPLTTLEYLGWDSWAEPQALEYAADYAELEDTFQALGPLVTTASGRENLEFYTEFMRWGSQYWSANHRVPEAAAKAPPELINYFLVNAGVNLAEKDLQADYGFYTEDPHGHHADPTSEPVENDFGYPLAMRSERWSHAVFGYRFDVPPAYDRYRVELYFQEGFFGVNIPGDPVGRRVFDIAINGMVVRENLDVAGEAGGSLKGIRLIFDVPITDGELDVQFRPVVSNPKVNIIRAYPIDANGDALPEEYAPGRPVQAWEELKASGFREAIGAYQGMVRDMPSQGGLISAAGGRWYETAADCSRCSQTAYRNYEQQIVAELPVAPPDAVAVRGTANGATLTWRPYAADASGIAGYHVDRRPAAGGEFDRLTTDPVTGTAYQDTADGEYVYAVTAVDQDGNESPRSYEEPVQAGSADAVPPRVLLIPRNLQAVRGEPVRVTAIAVDGRAPDHVEATLHYRTLGIGPWQQVPMERNPLARPYAFFADIPAGDVSKNTLEYYVEATDGAGNTSHAPAGAPDLTASATVTTTDPRSPAAVPRLSATWQPENNGVMLTWNAAAPGTHQYNIYRSEDPNFTPSRATYVTYVAASQRVFRDVNVEAGTTYHYRIEPETIDERTGPTPRHASITVPPE